MGHWPWHVAGGLLRLLGFLMGARHAVLPGRSCHTLCWGFVLRSIKLGTLVRGAGVLVSSSKSRGLSG